jgi:uncharacterized membrane protein
MQDKPLLTPYLLMAAAMVGLGITAFLSYFQYMNLIPSCAVGGCEIVLTSEHSKFFGVPWSYVGLVYYAYLFALSLLLAIDPRSIALRLGTLFYTGIGVLYSAWAIFYIQLSVIGALCEYCSMSALTTLALFALAVWHFRKTRGEVH